MSTKWLKLFKDAQRTKANFLLDGEAAYGAMLKAMDTADSDGHYIYILGWMLDIDLQLTKDEPDSTLYKHLSKAAANGVEIRILIWDNLIPEFAHTNGDAIPRLNKLPKTKAFVDEYTFFPAKSKDLLKKIAPYVTRIIQYAGDQLGPSAFAALQANVDVPVSYMVYRLLQLNNLQTVGAHHEKVTIVKGREGLVAFCGGIDYNRNRVLTTIKGKQYRFPYYHDVACRLQGPAAHEVLQKFQLRWKNHPRAASVSLLGANEAKPKASPDPYPYCKVVGTYNSPLGKDKIRTLKQAYLDIIDAAEKYVYIEDQYLVNIEVAAHLNAKLKQSSFEKAILVIQDSEETADIFIPNRKRGEFFRALIDGTSEEQKKKVLLALFDKKHWEQDKYHPGMHAKTLIVDDEIAIIGSANVNQRSFTCDSETSVIVFDDQAKTEQNFARVFRIATWKEYLRKQVPRSIYDNWTTFADALDQQPSDFAKITKYVKDSQPDLDVRISDAIRQSSVIGAVIASNLLNQDLSKTSVALSPTTVTYVFDTVWENLIDPKAD